MPNYLQCSVTGITVFVVRSRNERKWFFTSQVVEVPSPPPDRMLMRRRSSRDITNSRRMSRRDWREERRRSSLGIINKADFSLLAEKAGAAGTAMSQTAVSTEYEPHSVESNRITPTKNQKSSGLTQSVSSSGVKSPTPSVSMWIKPSAWCVLNLSLVRTL